MNNDDDWRTPSVRQKMVEHIQKILQEFPDVQNISRCSQKIESYTFNKAKNESEYRSHIDSMLVAVKYIQSSKTEELIFAAEEAILAAAILKKTSSRPFEKLVHAEKILSRLTAVETSLNNLPRYLEGTRVTDKLLAVSVAKQATIAQKNACQFLLR